MDRGLFMRSSILLSPLMAFANVNTLGKLNDALSEDDHKMPVLFIGHGSPMNAIQDNIFSDKWKNLGRTLPTPKAILCISAHWLTKGTFVTAMEQPKTIHDFGGFPQALFNVQYPAPGSPTLANETKNIVQKTNIGLDHEWGLDHGCWSVVRQMFPDAQIPVLQLSIDYHKPGEYHYALAKELASLRKKGVLIIGSGNMIHNLSLISYPAGEPQDMNKSGHIEFGFDWALEMDAWFKEKILKQDHNALLDYKKLHKEGHLAIPTPDHYFPLLYILSLQEKQEEATLFNDVCVMGSLSMTSVLIQ